MPTYQYACRSCDHRFEAVQGFHEQALQVCPECEAEDVRKLFGNVGVVFKGPGFYRTDSRSGKSGAGAGSSGAKSATSAGTDGGKASSSSGAGNSGSSGSSASGSSATGTAAKSTTATSTPSTS